MNKEEILSKSRQELKNSNLVEKEVEYQAGRISASVGATVCLLLSVIALTMTGEYFISPWLIYFSIVGTKWLVRFVKLKKKSDLFFSATTLIVAVVLLVIQILQFSGENV